MSPAPWPSVSQSLYHRPSKDLRGDTDRLRQGKGWATITPSERDIREFQMKRLILPVSRLVAAWHHGCRSLPDAADRAGDLERTPCGSWPRGRVKVTSTVTSMATLTSMAESTITGTAIGPIATAIVPSAGSSMAASPPGPSGTARNIGATARGERLRPSQIKDAGGSGCFRRRCFVRPVP